MVKINLRYTNGRRKNEWTGITSVNGGLWFCEGSNKITDGSSSDYEGSVSNWACLKRRRSKRKHVRRRVTPKAFVRFALKHWDEIPVGNGLYLASEYMGQADLFFVKRNP